MTAISAEQDEDDQSDPMPELALKLRQLILSGAHFQHALGRQLQVGPTDLTALRHVYDEGPLTPRELAARLGVTSGTVTPLLDRLEKPGFLTRNNNPQDRRSLLVSITPAGQHAMRWVEEQLDAALHHALQGLPELSLGQLADILTIFAHALDTRAALQTPAYVPLL